MLNIPIKNLFFTIKEMHALIQKLSETFTNMMDKSLAEKPRGRRNNLSSKAQKIVDKITNIQRTIMETDELAKYRVVKKKEKK